MENQLIEKYTKNIPEKYTCLIYTNEKEKGMLLSYEQFSKGNFVAASKTEEATLLTTMLLGSGTFLYQYLESEFSDFKPMVIKPNGFTSTTFEVKYTFGGNEVLVIRKMENKKLLLNPMAAENPKNYHLIYAFDMKEGNELKAIQSALISYLEQNDIAYEMKFSPTSSSIL